MIGAVAPFIISLAILAAGYLGIEHFNPQSFGALSVLTVPQGGTGTSTAGGVLAGNGTSAFKSVVIGSNLTWDGTTLSATGGAGASFGKTWELASGALTPTTTVGVIVSASSTVGDGTQQGGLTIAGGATTTGFLVIQGTATSTFAGPIYMTGTTAHLTSHGIRSDASDGLHIHANNWTEVANLGVGNTANAAFYGAVNVDGNLRGPTSLTSILYGNSGTLTNATISYPLQFSAPTLSLAFGTTTTNEWSNLQTFTSGFISAASSTFTGNATTTGTHGFGAIFIGNDRLTELCGTGITCTGGSLTASLGTDISAAEIANGDHGDFTYSGGSATLDADTVSDSEIDYSTVTLNDFTNDGDYVKWANATSSLWQVSGLLSTASSTFTGNATTTGNHGFGSIRVPNLTSAILLTDANGLFAEYAGSSCAGGTFANAISALGAVTCDSPAAASFPFTPTTYGGVAANATTSPIWIQTAPPYGLIASSTFSTYASTTQLTLGADYLTDFSTGFTISAAGVVTLDTTGDWTGTFDGLQGSAYLANSFSTTSANYWETQQYPRFDFTPTSNFGTTTSASSTPLWLRGSLYSLFASSTAVLTNASSTQFTNTGSTWLTSMTSALLLTGADGLVAEYAGSACAANNVALSLSALGAVTCGQINNAYWSGTDLSVANGGTGLSTFGGSNTVLYTTAADTLTSEAAFTYNSSVNRLTADFASSTAISATNLNISGIFNGATLTGALDAGGATSFEIPNGASPTTDAIGEIALDTTSNQLRLATSTGNVPNIYVNFYTMAFSYATTSWTGTTTLYMAPASAALRFLDVRCETDTGTLGVSLYDGTNRTRYIPTASTTANANSVAGTNASFTAGESIRVDVGNPASSPTKIACRYRYQYDPD